MSRPVAVDHYCAYLREAGEIDELHETLSALGRTEEAAMLKYKQCLASTATTTPEIRASGLKDCIKYVYIYCFESQAVLTVFNSMSLKKKLS